MKFRFLILLSFFVGLPWLAISGYAQNVRYDAPFPSVTSNYQVPFLVANTPATGSGTSLATIMVAGWWPHGGLMVARRWHGGQAEGSDPSHRVRVPHPPVSAPLAWQ